MYLSHDRMVKLLEHCGYSGEKVYVSCDYGTNKRDGGLYDVVKMIFLIIILLYILAITALRY